MKCVSSYLREHILFEFVMIMYRAPLKTLELACLPRRRGARHEILDRKEKGDGSATVLFSFPRRSPSPSLRRLLSDGDRQPQEPLEIIREILQANLRSCPHPPNGAKEFPSHRRDVMSEDMFDPGTNT